MISFPWDSIVTGFDEETGFPRYDRTYKAEELREVLKTFFSNGVFLQDSEAFVVTPNEGMSVLVSSGRCFIQGDVGVEQSTRELLLQAPSFQDRIDTIVLRWDANIDARSIDIYVREGVASATPVRPTLTRTESVWELGVADIYIAKNAQSVSMERITDTRLETSRCGAVTPFASIDTTTFYNQIQAAIDARMAELQEQTDKAVDLAQSAIDGTIAGNLQNQIDGLQDEKVSKSGDTMSGKLTLDVPLGVESGGTGVTSAKAIALMAYPVGSVYLSYEATSPASRFGGSWEKMTGRFIRMAEAVTTGGSSTASSAFLVTNYNWNHGSRSTVLAASTNTKLDRSTTTSSEYINNGLTSGSTQRSINKDTFTITTSTSTLPPYQNLYAWRRTA